MSDSLAVVVPRDGEKQLTVWSKSLEDCDDLPLNEVDKETSRLGDDIKTKVRKPYTITKQREQWTEEEHQRFLEAMKLYGRAWRQIEEHVGTKTAIQIRSHAQKFFSKLEREGSGSSKGPVLEIDIPPPRPKRKPAHPYPRKGVALNSHSARMQSRSLPKSGMKSPGCEVTLHVDDAIMPNKSPASNTPETSDQHRLKASAVRICQQPRKRGAEEVQCNVFPNESQETAKVSRSACAEKEPSLSSTGVGALQPYSLIPHSNIMPFGVYGSQMPVPYYHPMHSLAALPNTALLMNSVSKNHGQLRKLNDMPNFASLVAAQGQFGNSLMPWLNQNPIALVAAAAAAAAATTPWPGLGPLPPPPSPLSPLLHLPLRPSSDRLNVESPRTTAAAMAAAAAASFADASAWLAFHGTFTHPTNAPEVRSLFKPNPIVHSALAEGQQQQGLADSSEGSKNGVTISEKTSSDEHDASTIDGTAAYTNHPDPVADDHSLPSTERSHNNFCRCDEEALKNQENKGPSSTDNSCHVKKDKKRNGFSGTSDNGVLVESMKGLQNLAYVIVNDRTLGRLSIDSSSDQLEFSPSTYQGSNSPQSGTSPERKEGNGDGCAYKGKSNGSLDGEGCAYNGKINGSFTTSVHLIDCTLEEQSGSSAGKSKDCMDPKSITNTANIEIQEDLDVSMQHENGWPHKRHEHVPGEVCKARQCMSSCGSTENQKDKANNAPYVSSKPENEDVQERGPDHDIDDSGSENIACEKAGKFLVQACLKRWQGGKTILKRTCTNRKSAAEAMRRNLACRAKAKNKDSQQKESMAIGLIDGHKQSLPLIQVQSSKGSKASSSGSSRYSGHGFVPYRRD